MKFTQKDRILELYNQGLNAKEILEYGEFGEKYVKDLVCSWDCEKERIKQKHDAEMNFEYKPVKKEYSNVPETDFALLTNNQLVIEAFNRMINPVKLKQIA